MVPMRFNSSKPSPLYKDAFYEVFKSMQLSAAYVLYYDIDFSKEEVEEFQSKLSVHSDESCNHEISEKELAAEFVSSLEFDCEKEADNFPLRVKLKMYGKKYKQKDVITVLTAATHAVSTYLILSIYTLTKDYEFDSVQIRDWFNHLVEFCRLYADGLTDAHVLQYFKQECDLEITEN